MSHLYYSALTVIIILTNHHVDGDGICKGKTTCRSLPSCGPIMALIDSVQKPLKASVVQFLRAQQCGFADGYPWVCCGVLPQNLKIFQQKTAKRQQHNVQLHRAPLQQSVNKLTIYQPPAPDNRPHFDITVSTAPPGASTVPYLSNIQRDNFNTDFDFLSIAGRVHLDMYDLLRSRRSKLLPHGVATNKSEDNDKEQEVDIEIR